MVARSNHACRRQRTKVLVTPRHYRPNRFCGIPFAVGWGYQRPSYFGDSTQRGLHISLVIGKSDLPDKRAGRFLLDNPISETERHPMPNISQKSGPGFLFSLRFAADVLHDLRVCPHCGRVREVIHAMAAHSESLSFDDWYSRRDNQRCQHHNTLALSYASAKIGRVSSSGDPAPAAWRSWPFLALHDNRISYRS